MMRPVVALTRDAQRDAYALRMRLCRTGASITENRLSREGRAELIASGLAMRIEREAALKTLVVLTDVGVRAVLSRWPSVIYRPGVDPVDDDEADDVDEVGIEQTLRQSLASDLPRWSTNITRSAMAASQMRGPEALEA